MDCICTQPVATELDLVEGVDKVHSTGSLIDVENKRNVIKAIVEWLDRRAEVLNEQSAGPGYREIAELMKNTNECGLSFMGVVRVLNF